ncbi:CoA transferase [Burkholderia multivorans]|uniref:CoA transferase n=1 Tax=Burkholderia multivorans TaxID=87883 RepID=UPI000CFED4C1|nr:CoA transferase [Burkholderia multivorans]MBJ9617994.1 CoA transferase [Burkholderia multivorans]MBU9327082.1 CoA transferase [Burkholderia multivorans]MBU9530708.1 CoA transferase [Burkholderia multivorans]MDR8784361.1 Acetyl-CoA:oxalate CoA-transferase [Burkholderia multivorans]MDR8827288.1 Acetyl-CoA:oxalate CoA-transferase [Burkholderia multivorans]
MLVTEVDRTPAQIAPTPLDGVRLDLRSAPASFAPAWRALHRRMTALGVRAVPLPRDFSFFAAAPGHAALHARLGDVEGAYVDVTVRGWPSTDHPLSDALLQAATGITGWHARAENAWRPLGVDYVSTLGASLASAAALAALTGRRRGSGGAQPAALTLCLADAALFAMAQYLAMDHAGQSAQLPRDAADRSPPFESSDGVRFELEALDPDAWGRFWQHASAAADDIAVGWRPFMLRYTQARAALPSGLFHAAGRLDFATLRAIAHETGAYVSAVRDAAVALHDDARWSAAGPWRFDQPGRAIGVPAGPGTARAEPARPLAGVTVLEACRLIQGPLAGHVLRLLGARVIKIEPPGGDPMRAMPPLAGDVSAHFDAINRDKTCIELDLRTRAGRDHVLDLARDADVFLHNWAPGRAERLALTAADFARVAPALVYASASGAGRMPSPDDPVGTDFMVQAHSGLASLIGGPYGRGGALLTLVDVLGGVAAAEGVVAALYGRAVDGRARSFDSAMMGAAALLVADASEPTGEPACADPLVAALGLPAAYPARDGRLMLDAPPDKRGAARLAALCDVAPGGELPPDVRARLVAALAAHDVAYWQRDLASHGVPAVAIACDAAGVATHPLLTDSVRRNAGRLSVACPFTFTR